MILPGRRRLGTLIPVRGKGRSLSFVTACACLALAIGPASASAAPGWLPATDISASSEVASGRPKVAVGAGGDAVAIWERRVGGEEVVEASERPAGGEWSEPQAVTLPGEEGRESEVAIDAAGDAHAIWLAEGPGSSFVVRTATRADGGEWSDPEDLSAPFQDALTPKIAIDAAVDTVAVWTTHTATERMVQAAVHPPDGEWSAPEDLSAAGQNVQTLLDGPRVAIDAPGNAIAVWTIAGGVVQTAARSAGGGWGAPDDLSEAGEEAGEPDVAMNAAGQAVAAWTRFDGDDVIQGATRPAGGAWSEPDDLSATGKAAGDPSAAIDEAGEAVVVWTRFDLSANIVQAATHAGSGDWSEPDDLSTGGSAPVVAANDAVGAIATWYRFDGANFRVQATVRPPGGAWSEPDDLSAAGEGAAFPDLALDAAGNAIVVFGRSGSDGLFAQAAGYDFAAPRLDALRIPGTATVGEPVAFAVSPFDMFALAETSWSFGDGGRATGNAVSHVYSTAGTHRVTVSAIDVSGNTTTQTATIAVAQPSVPRPPDGNRQMTLSLAIQGRSLAKLLRTGSLVVDATVGDAGALALSGKAKLRARAGQEASWAPVFRPKTVRFDTAGAQEVRLALSKRGRQLLLPRSRARLSILGQASSDAGGSATATAARTLRARRR